jgi:hypothetical protein
VASVAVIVRRPVRVFAPACRMKAINTLYGLLLRLTPSFILGVLVSRLNGGTRLKCAPPAKLRDLLGESFGAFFYMCRVTRFLLGLSVC